MPFTSIWVHAVWATKDRQPILIEPFRTRLFNHIKANAIEKNIYLNRINGYTDHVHGLISLGAGQTIKDTLQLLKGESSHWFNKAGFPTGKLYWQDDYYAVSVSNSGLAAVQMYIDGQVAHHQVKTFAEEYEELIKHAGFQRFF